MKFKNPTMLVFYLWCFLCISPIFANINYIDFRQDFVNSGYAQNYYLTFSITNDLGVDQYMKLEFPIVLDATTGMAAAWTEDVLSATKLLPTYFPATITASTIPADAGFNRYFVKFLDSSNKPVKLTANSAYMLRVTSSQAYTAVSDGYVDIVRVFTTTSNQANHIILDSNPTFSPLYFLTPTTHPIATTTITVGSGGISAGSTQTVTVSYTPAVALTPRAKVIIELGSAEFAIQGSTCSLTLPSPFDGCSLPTAQKVIFTASSAVSTGSAITFSLSIKAPYQGSQTSSVTLLSIQDYYSDIKERGTLASPLSSTAVAWASTAYSATFAWGFSTVVDTSIPSCIQLYKNGPTQTVYNTIRFSFTVDSALPSSVYKVSVDLSGARSILANSILENFPVAPGSDKVICRGGTEIVECTNIDTLVQGSTYYIAIKVSLANTAGGLDADFGKIGLYATDDVTGTYSTGSLITLQRATFTVPTVANLDKQVAGTVPVTSWPPSVTPDATRPGLKTGSVNYYDFRLNTARADFGAATFANADSGLEFFTNGYIISAGTGPTCSSSGAGVGSGSFYVCSSTTLAAAFQSRSTLRFRVGWNIAGNNAVFNGPNGFQVTYSAGNEAIVSQGSYVADDSVTDFFFSACGSGIGTGANYITGCTSSYMVNAYTISSPGTGGFLSSGNFNVYVSNFWTSASIDYLTGNEFPTMIQIKGSFAATDYDTNTDRLSLFFTYLTPFSDADYASSNKVACSANVDVTCYYYPGDNTINNYMYYSRVDIFPTDGFNTNWLQIVVPVATVANQLSISTVLGLGRSYPSMPTTTSLGNLQKARLFSFAFTAFSSNQLYSVDNSNLNNVNYTLATTNMHAGEVTTGVIAANHIDATGVAFVQNTASAKSALFTWTTKYNFYPDRTTANQATADFTGSEVCVFFSYYYGTDTKYPYRYGVTCPVNSNLAMPTTPEPLVYIPDFVYPIVEGVNIPESFGSLSSNQGALTEFQRDVRTNATLPNAVVTAKIDPVLQQGEKGSIATLTFTTTNILPQNSVIKISTSTVPLQFSVKEGPYCALYQDTVPDLGVTALPGNCYQTSSEYELTFVITNSAAWTSNVYFLKLYEINITSYIQVSSQTYNVSTYTSQYFMIDTTTTTASTVTPVYFLTQVRSSDISIGDAVFLSNAMNTRSQILVTVTTSAKKPLTRFDEMRIKFWTVSDALDENFYCDVVDYGLSSTFVFQYCKVDPPFVALRPYYDLLTPSTFTIRLSSVKNPNIASTLSFHQLDLEGNYMMNSTNSLTYPSTFAVPPIFNTFVLEKRYNYITMFPEFIFTLNLKIPITKDNTLIFRFPSGYSAADITEPLLCIIDDLESHCYLSNFQEITITDLPLPQAANQIFRVFILGLRQPDLTKTFNISLQISTKTDLYTPLAYQELRDTIPLGSGTLNPIHVPQVTLGTAFALDSPDITIQFNIDSTGGGSLSSRSLILDFPNLFGMVYHNVTLDYTLRQGGTNMQSGKVKFRLFRLEIPLTVSLSETVTYTIVLRKIPNPFLPIYAQPLILLSITGSNTFVLGYQGVRPIINIAGPVGYYYNPLKNNLKFSQINGDTKTAMSYNAPFQVYSGLPTLQFELAVASGVRFDRSVWYTSSSFNKISFTGTPDPLNATCGLYGYEFSLTLPTSAAPGFYALKFDKVEINPATLLPTDIYSQIPPLLIQIIATRNTIKLPKFVDNTLSLAENGYSFPITFDLSEFKPPTSLTIVAYIPPTSDMEIQYEAYTEITLTAAEPTGSFTLVHMSGGIPGTSKTTISFYLDGPDKDLYAIEQTPIQVALVNLPTTLPSLTVNFDTASVTSTSFEVTASCDQITQIYYSVTGYYGYPTKDWQTSINIDDTDDLAYVKEMVRVGTLYENDQFQRRDQFFGVWLYETTGVTEPFGFSGLRSNVEYTLKVWAVNLEGTSSIIYENTFTTPANSGSRVALTVSFDQILENRQINEIACFIMVRHRLPYENVKDFLGYSCNDDRTMNPTDEDNVLSGQNRVYQLRGVSTYTYRFYVYPLGFQEYDDTTINVMNSVVNGTFVDDLRSLMSTWNFSIPSIVGTPTSVLLTSTDVAFRSPSGSTTTTEFTVTSTNSSIALNNVRLNQAGFVWVYALRKSAQFSTFSDLFIPSKGDFKYYLNRRLDDQNYVAMRYYDGSTTLQILFDGLDENEDYILHWFGQNDDPGAQNRTTYTYTTFVSTKSDTNRLFGFTGLIMTFVIMIISLIL